MRAYQLAMKTPWAMTEEALAVLLRVASRDVEDVAALETRLGRPLDNARVATVRDGVATIPIVGPIFRHANLFTQISGATSLESVALDVQAALDNPSVTAIVLHLETPGGEVAGTNELSDFIYEARGQKPIVAYAADLCCSAGYWIGSACDEIVADPTATLGSIGVCSAVWRVTDEERDAKVTFVSSQSPRKLSDPDTPDGRDQIQYIVDTLAGVFIDTVARNRAVTPETVLAQYGQGGVFIGNDAVRAGLADRLGSYEGLLRELSTADTRRSAPRLLRPAAVAPHPVGRAATSPPHLSVSPAALVTEPGRVGDLLSLLDRHATAAGIHPIPAAPTIVSSEGEVLVPEEETTLATLEDSAPADGPDTTALLDQYQQDITRANEQITALLEQVKANAAQEQERRLTALVTGADGSGVCWHGDVATNARILGQVIAANDGDEDAPLVQAFIQQQRGLVAQLEDSTLVAELGNEEAPVSGSGAKERLEQVAAIARAEDPSLSYEQAMVRAMDQHKDLASQFIRDSKGRS